MAANLISVGEARKLILQHVSVLPPVEISLLEATAQITASDLFAGIDIPGYPQSSMDGYAISFAGWQRWKTLTIKGESAAGMQALISMNPEEAVRIFTGAPVPDGADTVVMQEKTNVKDGKLFIDDSTLAAGANVRPKGAEIKADVLALKKLSLLTAPAIGFLVGIGLTRASVFPSPRVCIIITGNELQQPGNLLKYGQVYESNSYALKAALGQSGIRDISVFNASDNKELLTDILNKALQQADVVLLTGGVSVGDYDFVVQAADQCGVETIFHRVKQRPGKPLFFGKQKNKLVFGLPGNPASVITCYYEYVTPALAGMSHKRFSLQVLHVPLANQFKKMPGLTHFLKGYYDGTAVSALQAQESYRLSSFANANCLIQIDEESTNYDEGELVEIHLLPQ